MKFELRKFFVFYLFAVDLCYSLKRPRAFPVEISATEYSRNLRPAKFFCIMPITSVRTSGQSPWIAVKLHGAKYLFAVKINNRNHFLSLCSYGRSKKKRLGLSCKNEILRKATRVGSSYFHRLFEYVRDHHTKRQLLRHVASDQYVSVRSTRGRFVLPELVADSRQASAFLLS